MSVHTVLIIGTVWVAPNSSAAGSRMLQLIQLFKQQNWNVTFACAAQKSANAVSLANIGVQETPITLNSSSFDDFITKLKPTIVLFDRFLTEEQFGWRIAEYCPTALRILDTEDLHFLRKVRHQQYKRKEVFTAAALLQSVDAKREIASILRCDLSLIISTYEMDLLKNLFKIDERLCYYLPFLLNKIDEHQANQWNSFEDRAHFVFIGNFLHKPNIDAVLTLKKYIWKAVKKQLPDAEMHIYGAYCHQHIQDLHQPKEGFFIKGFAENAQEVIKKAKVLLAPLQFGAGIKGKLTEAMICGTPNVTTSIGAEGMHAHLPWAGCIADNYDDFIRKSIALYSNKTSWKEAQKKGIAIINTIYDKERLSSPFFNRILEVYQNLEAHRTQNFLGSMLQHQTLQATKYMSKWIEAKNNKE